MTTAPLKLTRGERNCNPGNIRKGAPWKGLSPEQPDPSFCTFKNPEFGIRAMVLILRTYARQYKINTVAGVVARWAPAVENDTQAYIAAVCDRTGFKPHQPLDMRQPDVLFLLVKALIYHENGRCIYDDAMLQRGVVWGLG